MTSSQRPPAGKIAGHIVRQVRAAYARMGTSRRDVLLLVTLGIVARALTAALIHHPGYADAAYYYGIARNVAMGHGLTENFIFTYLAPAQQVVHPSNLYWMPGASLLLVPFFWVFGVHWWVAELPNVLLTGAFPALAYALGRELAGTRRVALGAGLLTLTSGFYYPLYYPLPDNFGLFGWAAGGALLLMSQSVHDGKRAGRDGELRDASGADSARMESGGGLRPWRFALAGIGCGLAHLARAEGPLLLIVAGLFWGWTKWRAIRARRAATSGPSPRSLLASMIGLPVSGPFPRARGEGRERGPHLIPLPLWSLAALLGCYLLVMAPWFVRNLLLVGAPLPTGGLRTAWLRDYNDFFSYGLTLTPGSYLAWGIGPILLSKLQASLDNARELAGVMEFVLAPFALIGIWRLWRKLEALPWLLYLLGGFVVMSLVFTFPGSNGGVLHTEIAVFPYLNVAAVVGLDATLEWIGRRAGAASAARTAERKRVYLGIAVALSVILSTFLVLLNAPTLDAKAATYAHAGQIVAADAARHGEHTTPVVMVVDPTNYVLDTDQLAITIPDMGLPTMTAAARRYGARYLILETLHSAPQESLWTGKERAPQLALLWSAPGIRVYRWNW